MNWWNSTNTALPRSVFCECFDCHETWWLDPGSSTMTLIQCYHCGSMNVKQYGPNEGYPG